MDLIATMTPLLIVFVLLVSLLIGGAMIGEELAIDFNNVFETINGEKEK